MFSLATEITYYVRSFVRFLYPPYCAICQKVLSLDETHICYSCEKKITPIQAPCCRRCSHPLPAYGPSTVLCQSCRSNRPYFDRGFSLISYDDQSKEIFHQAKFQKKPWLFDAFRVNVKKFSQDESIASYDMIIPVPLDSRREHDREFNQADLIAHMLIRQMGLKIPVKKLLKKNKITKPQSQLHRLERLHNLKNAFSVRNSKSIQNKSVLLVDDIITTGSTLNECAKLLKEHGAARVDFFTLARAQTI